MSNPNADGSDVDGSDVDESDVDESDVDGSDSDINLSEFGDIIQNYREEPNGFRREWYLSRELYAQDDYDYRKDKQLFPPNAWERAEKYIKENNFALPHDYKEKIKTWLEVYQKEKSEKERNMRKNKKCRLSHTTLCDITVNYNETELSKILKGYYKDQFANVSFVLHEMHADEKYSQSKCDFVTHKLFMNYEIYKEHLTELIDTWIIYLNLNEFRDLGRHVAINYNNNILRNIKTALYDIDWSYEHHKNKIPYDHDSIPLRNESLNNALFEAMFKYMPEGNGISEVINGKRYVAIDAIIHKTTKSHDPQIRKWEEKKEAIFDSRMRDFKDKLYIFDITKQDLWYLIRNDHELSTLPFSLIRPYCIFTHLITHGLDFSSIGRRKWRKWHKFLTEGLYDPRLLILIYRFVESHSKNEFALRINGL